MGCVPTVVTGRLRVRQNDLQHPFSAGVTEGAVNLEDFGGVKRWVTSCFGSSSPAMTVQLLLTWTVINEGFHVMS